MRIVPRPRTLTVDRIGITLSALCVVHCLATLGAIALLASAGLLGDPLIHRVGLGLAVLIGAVALGQGALRHRRAVPLLLGGAGLLLMASALAVPHGPAEALVTVIGVSALAVGHWRNAQASRGIAGGLPRV